MKMTMHYFDESRALDPHALPDLEVWHEDGKSREGLNKGWYWWAVTPGCLPECAATGPFDSEQEALDDARSE
jgi:hypothetical protein